MASSFYNSGLTGIMDGTLPLVSATDIRVLPLLSSYSFSATSTMVSDIVASEPTGGPYRVALTGETLTLYTGSTPDAMQFIADNPTFLAVGTGQTIAVLALYKHNAADASAALICYIALTSTATNGGNIVIDWYEGVAATAGGILNIAVSA